MYNEIINFATREYPFLIKHISVRYIPHFHQETELVYIMKGELTFTLGMAVYTVREGDICIIPPNLIHNLYTDDYSESFVMKLYSVVDLSNIHPEKHILQCNDPGYETLRSYICGIIRENDSKEEHYRLAVNIYAEEIFLFILRNTQYHKVDSKSKLRHINESKFLDTINGYLETHYADDFSLTDIAEYLNYTKSYFCILRSISIIQKAISAGISSGSLVSHSGNITRCLGWKRLSYSSMLPLKIPSPLLHTSPALTMYAHFMKHFAVTIIVHHGSIGKCC